MPRIAHGRAPAEPQSAEQAERRRSILRAASRLGAEHGLERMQMNDVATEAGVAIATLYRYFPSKTELLVGVLHSQVEHLQQSSVPVASPESRATAVADVLVSAGSRMLERPKLAMAMLQSNNSAQLHGGREYTPATMAFHGVLLAALGVDADPTDEDYRMVRIVEQAWYGILISVLNGVIDQDQSEADVRLAARLLLGPFYDGGATQ